MPRSNPVLDNLDSVPATLPEIARATRAWIRNLKEEVDTASPEDPTWRARVGTALSICESLALRAVYTRPGVGREAVEIAAEEVARLLRLAGVQSPPSAKTIATRSMWLAAARKAA